MNSKHTHYNAPATIITTLIILAILFSYRCTFNVAGGVSEETNARISGIVRDSTGTGVAGVMVTCRQIIITENGEKILIEKQVLSNDTGRYEFDSLPDGRYAFSCSYNTSQLSAIRSKFTLRPDSCYTDIDFTLSPPVIIKGRVISDINNNLVDIIVFIPGLNKGTSIITETNTEGFYTISGVPQGQFEIAFLYNNVINYLPVSINSSSKDTIYIKEIYVHNEACGVARTYSYFPYNNIKCLGIIPVEYKQTNEPYWYTGKSFNMVTYYRGTNESLNEYIPQINQILLVGRFDTSIIYNDFVIIKKLRQNGYTVFLMDDDSLVIQDTLGMDLLYATYSILSTTLGQIFTNVPKPVITSEYAYFDDLKIAQPTGFDTIRNTLIITAPSHPLAAGLRDTVVIANGLGKFSWGKPAPDAHIIAVDPHDRTRALLFCYETGEQMIGMQAPARRIGFYANVGVAGKFNYSGWLLFDAMIVWALGK